jgi:hypothetical protein
MPVRMCVKKTRGGYPRVGWVLRIILGKGGGVGWGWWGYGRVGVGWDVVWWEGGGGIVTKQD